MAITSERRGTRGSTEKGGVRVKLVACVFVLGSRRDPFTTDYYLNGLRGSVKLQQQRRSIFSGHLQRRRYFSKTIFFRYDRNVDSQRVIDDVSVHVSEISRNWRRFSIHFQETSTRGHRSFRLLEQNEPFVSFDDTGVSSDDRTEHTNPREIAIENRRLIRIRERNEMEETRRTESWQRFKRPTETPNRES